jgi:hypothetical protein
VATTWQGPMDGELDKLVSPEASDYLLRCFRHRLGHHGVFSCQVELATPPDCDALERYENTHTGAWEERCGGIEKLWVHAAIQNAFRARAGFQHRMAAPDSAAFFFKKAGEIGKRGYVPTVDDYLRFRVKTTGALATVGRRHPH